MYNQIEEKKTKGKKEDFFFEKFTLVESCTRSVLETPHESAPPTLLCWNLIAVTRSGLTHPARS